MVLRRRRMLMDKYLKTADTDWYKQRITGVIVCALAAFVVLFIRLIVLQVIMGDEYRRLSLNNSIRLQSIDPPRGRLYDRNGDLLVDNRPSFDVNITLKDAEPLKPTLEKLAVHLNTPADALLSQIKQKRGVSAYSPLLLQQDVGRDTLASIEVNKIDLPGVSVDVNLRRHYLHERQAAHLVGYLSEISPAELKSGSFPDSRSGDLIGKFGAEKVYENLLRGKRGGRQVEVNVNGLVVRILKTVEAEPGHNVYLTIDQNLQHRTEVLLDGVVGAAVAIEPSSGKILALASSPSFDQNSFVGGITREQWDSLITNPFRPMSNRAIQGEYPPGSTYKIITALAGLQEGVVDDRSVFHCPGHYRFGNRIYRCWKKGGHGKVDIVKAVEESCDVYFYQVGQGLGVDRLAWYAKAFGLGSPTGVRLDHEANGLVPTAAWKKRRTGVPWQKGETLSIAIGQGFNLATPIQMAVLAAAVANGGHRYQPQILDNIKTVDGQLLQINEPKLIGKLPVSPVHLERVKLGLWKVVNSENGTARGSRLTDIDISGKTGTSQVISRKDNESIAEEDMPVHFRSHAWFIAYAPSEKPAIAVAVVIEHGEHGSGAAAPIAKEMIKTFLRKPPVGSQVATQKAANNTGGDG
jgi:penicillin-binding protein 2